MEFDEISVMRIFLVTDAWEPQVNGVVRTLSRVIDECRGLGHEVEVVAPTDGFKTVPLITYPEIRLAVNARARVEERFLAFAPDAVHIATEGTLGIAMRSICIKHRFPFSTSYHTRFPEYVTARLPIPLWAGYAYMRWFHRPSGRMLVATPSMRDELVAKRFTNIEAWSRGVDTEMFHPAKRGVDGGVFGDLPRPIMLSVGRVAVEKNLEEFLKLDLPGTKMVIGDGPQREELKEKYPDAHFPGPRFGEELARCFADSDVFVFPSLTDTFGLVILEAMAAGTPVAAFPAPGPRDIIPGSKAGAVDENLRSAIETALGMDRADCRAYAERFSWTSCAEEFVRNLQQLPPLERRRFWKRLRLLRLFRRKKAKTPAAVEQRPDM